MEWSPILTLMPQLSQIQYSSVTMGSGSKWVTHIYLLMWKDIRMLFDVFNSIWDKVRIWVASLFCHNFWEYPLCSISYWSKQLLKFLHINLQWDTSISLKPLKPFMSHLHLKILGDYNGHLIFYFHEIGGELRWSHLKSCCLWLCKVE